MVRAVALPTTTASSRMRRIRASGANSFPLEMPTTAEHPEQFGIARSDRFVLDELFENLPVAPVIRRHGVEGHMRALDDDRLLRRRGRGEWSCAGEECRDGGADAARGVMRDAQTIADRVECLARIVVDHECAQQQDHAVRARVRNIEPAVGQGPVILRTDDQVAAAVRRDPDPEGPCR